MVNFTLTSEMKIGWLRAIDEELTAQTYIVPRLGDVAYRLKE